MRYVLRLETEYGVGIYFSGVARDAKDKNVFDAYDSYTHPPPWEDSMLRSECEAIKGRSLGTYLDKNKVFGFRDVYQFRQWFYNDEALKYANTQFIKLSIYHASEYLIGNAQCVFDRTSADLVTRLDCTASNKDIEAAIERHEASQ
jgi:hypothetical protein